MNTPRLLGCRNTLNTMNSCFKSKEVICARTRNLERRLLEATHLTLRTIDRTKTPSFHGGITLIHFCEILRKNCSLLAAHTSAHFKHEFFGFFNDLFVTLNDLIHLYL